MSALPRQIIALSLLIILLSTLATRLSPSLRALLRPMSTTTVTQTETLPRTQDAWRQALAALPAAPAGGIPAFYFGHGSPLLAMPTDVSHPRFGVAMGDIGPNGTHAKFLRDFGPALLQKYKPKGIVVFSAHWDAPGDRLVTDYGDENPLLYDYYGFDPQMYKLGFKSRGDSRLSQHVVELLKKAGQPARTTSASEPRGRDGRGFNGPGFDHGVFIPFRIMFGETFTDVPIVEVSMDGSLRAADEWALGAAVADLRKEGILVLSGGLTVHNLRDFASFSEGAAGAAYKAFDQACLDAVSVPEPVERKRALVGLMEHHAYKNAHPSDDHFVPLYVAAGAGGDGAARVLQANYGIHTYAFGL